MLFTEAHKHEVISTSSARKVGQVDTLVIDLAPPRVRLLLLRKTETKGSILDWNDLQAFGTDAVTVEAEESIRKPRDNWEQAAADGAGDVLGKAVLTERGDLIGTVSDVDFDPESGAVGHLVVDAETVSGTRIIGHGDYAVVVTV